MKKIKGLLILALILIYVTGCGSSKFDSKFEQTAEKATEDKKEDNTDRGMTENTTSKTSYDISAEAEIPDEEVNTEEYSKFEENPFREVKNAPLSTFSIDVDTASYSNIRRFINNQMIPPTDAVRVEEMVNYFNYDYPQPKGDVPFSITLELGECPWNNENYIAMIGLQGTKIDNEELPPSNLVFLLDVSGSMNDPNKLPLLKSSFKMLVEELDEKDKVSIVVYAGAAGVILDGARGNEGDEIIEALDRLEAGGSTAGAEGIELAYKVAKKNYAFNGNNRVILATDGDFNVGLSSESELETFIEEKRNEGIYLSILGFGMGNLKDNKMELLADKGNGNYAYIDNLKEAKKVLVTEMGGTLYTIAKDVKIQVEFNPILVAEYKLIGYENRLLNNEDFADDKKDAGELGAGHSVTALYEIIPRTSKTDISDELKYQTIKVETKEEWANEWMEVRLRYKKPDENTSKKIVTVIKNNDLLENNSTNFNFAVAVAEFGLLLRDSNTLENYNIDNIYDMAAKNLGEDKEGYRKDFLNLVYNYMNLVNRDE